MIRKSIIWSIVCCSLMAGCVAHPQRRAHQVVAVDTRLQLGKAYLAERNLPAAKFHFEKILLVEPRHPEAHLGMALHEQYAGQPESADRYYRMAMQYATGNDTVVRHYSVFLCEQKRYEEAKKLSTKNNTNLCYCSQC
ncbi:fimbrial assembly protein [Xenorhabdus sp. Flor]|uniref:Type IV pilus assembly protein PilF n=2 Tax=Xenorhabdus cabanillasii TaxID=351673 RepID=A0A3D9UDJ6_9GAMM|nr:fimbrial assembly protein [Xenorhabdus sp. Flor]REF27568.1 type IV pilus assembly protein PilF [Xenorhabdus cabanillasii]